MSALPPLIRERPDDAALVEGLIDRAFGPGRHAKTAERLREGRTPILALSFVAWADGRAVGCVRQWAITIGPVPALLLGPFAVDADYRARGLGAALIRRARAAASEAGRDTILLVGDAAYFGPLGFVAAADRGIVMPGPVDQGRVLLSAPEGAAPVGRVQPLGPLRLAQTAQAR